MDFDLSATQKLMQQAARSFLAKECPTRRVRALMATDTACDAELWNSIAEQGWLGISVAEDHGGLGLGALELAVIAEETGRACLPGPFISHVWATSLLAASDNPLRGRLLPLLCTGEQRATVALLEKNPSWDPRAVEIQAETIGSDLRLTGRKILVSDAGASDSILCVVREQSQFAIALIEPKARGVTVRRTPAMDETRSLYELRLDGVLAPADAVLYRGAEALRALAISMQTATVAVCGELVGVMSRVLEMAVEYVKTRQQFGRPVGSFQAVQQQCVDMLLWLESARSATYYAAWALSSHDPSAATAVSIAKAYASDAAREVVNRGVQVHGGIGFTWEHDLHLFYKRAKSNEILFGDAAYHRERVAQLAIDRQAA